MSKNISVKEGGVSRYFTAQKIRTNLQGGSTCDWVPIDEVDDYVELEELNVTENGIYYPAEKVGISKVSVDVPQQGSSVVPTGVSVRATAAENLTAGDCVYIISGGTGGIAAQAQCYLNGTTYTRLASGGGYVYFKSSNTSISRIPINDLTATPEVYLSDLYETRLFSRNIITYRLRNGSSAGDYIVKNVKTGAITNGSIMYQGLFSQNYVGFETGFYGIGDLSLVSSICPYANNYKMITPNDYIQVGQNQYFHTKNGSTTTINFNTPIYSVLNASNVINNKLICCTYNQNGNGKYEVGYYDLNADDGVFHNLKDSNGNNIVTPNKNAPVKFNADGNKLLMMLGSGVGLLMVSENLSTAIYTNITGTDESSEMFGNYYYDNGMKQCFYVPQESVMGKTNAKAHEGSLGFVGADVAAGNVGVATEMFR